MLQYCHCGAKKKFADMYKAPAPLGWGGNTKEVWVCPLCNNPSHAVQEPVAVTRGPKNASTLMHAKILHGGQQLLTWKRGDEIIETVEYRAYPRKIPMANTEPLIFTIWSQLMAKVEIILKPPAGPSDNSIEAQAREQARYEGRGMAEALAVIMAPFLSTPDEVVRAAVKKYKNPDYEVPGLGEHLWDPMRNADGSLRTPVAAPKAKPAAKPKAAAPKVTKEAELSEADKEGIRTALQSGMFDAKALAEMYKVNESTITALA